MKLEATIQSTKTLTASVNVVVSTTGGTEVLPVWTGGSY